jgi:hypothetical protein
MTVIVATRVGAGGQVAFLRGDLPGLCSPGAQPLRVSRWPLPGRLLERVGEVVFGGRHGAGQFGHLAAWPGLGVVMPGRFFAGRIGHQTSRWDMALDHLISALTICQPTATRSRA